MKPIIALILALAPIMAGSGALPVDREYRSLPARSARVGLEELVEAAASAAGIPAGILSRILALESGGDPRAIGINPDGSRDLGIAQLGERWLADFAWFDNGGRLFDPFNPSEAIPVAARYLRRLYRATGSWRGAVAAYNCGLARSLRMPWPARTVRYVEEVCHDD